ncbi:COPI-coated vesicle protein, putative [Paecilomyces variotii No. 5]|uniref:COPI-coated vesicle protein, putative n=1 Tax=Byssochlamys spectabilis (strain No. 5 / NBRC 109023) TaxID=1356009 RepID=V5FWG1_BYSSN|nr:COPI-coated vesicle protein, putative [Paecilomyces variotii No. 5]
MRAQVLAPGNGRLVNIAVGAIMILGGIAQFFPGSVSSIIVGAYVIVFGLIVAGLEFLPQIPDYVYRYASFLFSFLGRGIFYIFVGSIMLHSPVIRYIAGSIVGFTGVGYVVLEFIPSIEPPANMREADNTWGAEQV